jgi:trehalose-phosphatase
VPVSDDPGSTHPAYDAVIFDLDGVLTDTASLHFKAWREMFDAYLPRAAGPEAKGEFTQADYRRFVDGKPRYDGVESFLESRGISLPYGDPGDSPDRETVCGLGNRKNEVYHRLLKEGGVDLFESTLPVLARLEEDDIAKAVVSSSRNTRLVLESAGIIDRFGAVVDGNDLSKLDLPGKPDPALFLEAARRLGVTPGQAVVVEDATSGVQAGRDGDFGLVVGVDRDGAAEGLRKSGADVVVRDLGELPGLGRAAPREVPIARLPSALNRLNEMEAILLRPRPLVFLDYDGTLTPIVDDPSEARLPSETRDALRRLADLCTLAVVSGRDRKDVQELVGLDDLYYAGSHGFDVRGPGGSQERKGDEYVPTLREAGHRLESLTEDLDGVQVERKRYAVAVHFRNAGPGLEPTVRARVERVRDSLPDLRMTGGKMIFELRPDLEWDKGRAILHLQEIFRKVGEDGPPLYVGDDLTDEDAFRALEGSGIGVVVRGEEDDRPTEADYSLAGPGQVRTFLEEMIELLEGRGA